MWIAGVGRAVFAATMVALGVLGFAKGDFIAIWLPVPPGLPAREWLAYLCALIPLVAGIGLVWKRTAHAAAGTLLAWLLLWLLVFRVPAIFRAPLSQEPWSGAGEAAVYAAGAWALYGKGARFAKALYGLAMIPFGAAHFAFLHETAQLVPTWLPFPLAWACLTGSAFLAAGVAIVAGVLGRLAAALSALQMGLFTVLVWVPIVMAGPDAFQWNEFVISCTLTAAAWAVADSYRGTPWVRSR
jgi:uncharacterized membrane protein